MAYDRREGPTGSSLFFFIREQNSPYYGRERILMRKITRYFRRAKLEYFYIMAKFCLNRANEHVEEDEFWSWMDKYGKYSRKYFELYPKAGL